MITTYLQGGLGNYLFQIVAAYTHSLDMNTECLFNEKKAHRIHRPISVYKDNILRNVNFTNNNISCSNTHYEHLLGFNYNELPKINDLHLDGYYQTEKYFNHRREDVLNLFKPREEDIKYITDKYGDLSNACSIHIRHGDYVDKKDHHPVCSLDYYKKGVEIIGGSKFLIFSDDIEWCKLNFKGESFIFVENELDYIDLYLMSMCPNNIIANSTFSWWGAWLNNSVNKIVIAPKQWFGSAKRLNTDDVIPEEWIQI